MEIFFSWYKTKMTGSVNTGTQDREGRTIFKGSKGGYFTRRGDKKVYRKTMGSQPTATGIMNALGREIMEGPRGGRYVMVAGKRRKPAVRGRKSPDHGIAKLFSTRRVRKNAGTKKGPRALRALPFYGAN
jgi:hypothetical protein